MTTIPSLHHEGSSFCLSVGRLVETRPGNLVGAMPGPMKPNVSDLINLLQRQLQFTSYQLPQLPVTRFTSYSYHLPQLPVLNSATTVPSPHSSSYHSYQLLNSAQAKLNSNQAEAEMALTSQSHVYLVVSWSVTFHLAQPQAGPSQGIALNYLCNSTFLLINNNNNTKLH